MPSATAIDRSRWPATVRALTPADPVRRLVESVAADCAAAGIALVLSADAQVAQGGLACTGFFVDRPAPTLAVATGANPKLWPTVLAHEASHFDQWRTNAPVWRDLFALGDEASAVLDAWLTGERELAPHELHQTVAAIQAVELDAERRTLARLPQAGLTVDAADYARKANAYVHFYEWAASHRRWHDGRPPYALEEVWSRADPVLPETPRPCPTELMAAFERAYARPSARPRP